MSQLYGKMKVAVEIKPPADKVYAFYACTTYQLPKASPEMVQNVNLLEGQWGKKGSVLCWNYVVAGNAAKNKTITEGVDYKNKSITYKVIEGDILELYKSFKFTLQVTPKEESSLVQWTFEYEKLNENVPDAEKMVQTAAHVCKDVDAHLTQAKTQRSLQLQCN